MELTVPSPLPTSLPESCQLSVACHPVGSDIFDLLDLLCGTGVFYSSSLFWRTPVKREVFLWPSMLRGPQETLPVAAQLAQQDVLTHSPGGAPAEALVLFPLQVITPYTSTPSTTPWVTRPRPCLPGLCAR